MINVPVRITEKAVRKAAKAHHEDDCECTHDKHWQAYTRDVTLILQAAIPHLTAYYHEG